MEKILEYTRLTFEERFMDKSSRFKCTKEFAKQGFGSCVCIPGIAINFCLILAEHCFTDMKITEEIHWDDQYKLYLPICTYNEERIAPNKTIENSIKCKLADEICKDNPNEFAYIKIRDVNSLNALYSSKGPYFKELLIVDKTEKFSNSMDFLSLFVGVANSSRMSRSLESYADSLFRLFIFLFPFTAFTLIEKNIKNQKGNIDFAKYNIDLLNEYKQLGIGAKDKDTMGANQISSTINLISDFLRFNFLHIYDAHKDMGGAESIQGIRDLIKKQLDLCSKSEIRIQALIDKI